MAFTVSRDEDRFRWNEIQRQHSFAVHLFLVGANWSFGRIRRRLVSASLRGGGGCSSSYDWTECFPRAAKSRGSGNLIWLDTFASFARQQCFFNLSTVQFKESMYDTSDTCALANVCLKRWSLKSKLGLLSVCQAFDSVSLAANRIQARPGVSTKTKKHHERRWFWSKLAN